MLFKLSVKNMKKSFKDYAIYFLTLVLGVAIFYMFNSLDSQQAMLDVSASTRDMMKIDGFNVKLYICICCHRTGVINCICKQLFNKQKKKRIWNLYDIRNGKKTDIKNNSF